METTQTSQERAPEHPQIEEYVGFIQQMQNYALLWNSQSSVSTNIIWVVQSHKHRVQEK